MARSRQNEAAETEDNNAMAMASGCNTTSTSKSALPFLLGVAVALLAGAP